MFIGSGIDLYVSVQIPTSRQVPHVLFRRAEFTAKDLPAIRRYETLPNLQLHFFNEVIIHRCAERSSAILREDDVRMQIEATRNNPLIGHAPVEMGRVELLAPRAFDKMHIE